MGHKAKCLVHNNAIDGRNAKGTTDEQTGLLQQCHMLTYAICGCSLQVPVKTHSEYRRADLIS